MTEVWRAPLPADLSWTQLADARRRLEELAAEARVPGGDLWVCPPQWFDTYSLSQPRGRQIYRSFSDEALLDIVLTTMQHHGHTPRYEEIFCVYIWYIKERFGNLAAATGHARRRMKRLKEQEKWPPDWPARVAAEPLLEALAKKNRAVTPEESALLERLCAEARRTGFPPALGAEEKARLDSLGLGGYPRALAYMGIPWFRGGIQRHMERFWREARSKQTNQGGIST